MKEPLHVDMRRSFDDFRLEWSTAQATMDSKTHVGPLNGMVSGQQLQFHGSPCRTQDVDFQILLVPVPYHHTGITGKLDDLSPMFFNYGKQSTQILIDRFRNGVANGVVSVLIGPANATDIWAVDKPVVDEVAD